MQQFTFCVVGMFGILETAIDNYWPKMIKCCLSSMRLRDYVQQVASNNYHNIDMMYYKSVEIRQLLQKEQHSMTWYVKMWFRAFCEP